MPTLAYHVSTVNANIAAYTTFTHANICSWN